jgi:hypothetical protein
MILSYQESKNKKMTELQLPPTDPTNNLNTEPGFNSRVGVYAIDSGYEFVRPLSSSESSRKLRGYGVDDMVDSAIAESPLGPVFGFSSSFDSETHIIHMTVPNVDMLNKLKTGLKEKIPGVNSGTFVNHDQQTLSYSAMTGFLADRKIPLADKGDELIHDSLLHAAGFAAMHDDIFESIVTASQKAQETEDADDHKNAVLLAEFVSGLITNAGGEPITSEKLTEAYQRGGLSVEAAQEKAEEDVIKQNELNKQILHINHTKSTRVQKVLKRLRIL